MHDLSDVKLKFVGHLAVRAGRAERCIKLVRRDSDSGRETVEALRKSIEAIIGSDVLYSVLINGRSINMLLNEGYALADGDEITVVPVILGG